MKWPLALAALAILANAVTLGGIGRLLYEAGDRVASGVFPGSLGHVHGDYLWPIAFWMGTAWPLGALVLFLLYNYSRAGVQWSASTWGLFLLSLIVLDVVLAAFFHLGAASMSAMDGVTIIPPEEA